MSSDGRTFFDELVVKDGLGKMVIESAFDQVKGEMSESYQKLRRFTPYVHPQADFLSAKAVWERFAPEINASLSAIQAGPEELTAEGMHQMLNLYAAQNRFPPQLMQQVIYFQQRQYNWIQPDPILTNGELSIGGLHSLEEWFGPKFLEKLSVAVLNGAAKAEKKGIEVSRKEARAKLYLAAAERLKSYNREGPVTKQDAERAVAYQLRNFGLEETRAVDLWRHLLAFQRDLDETAASVFVDRLSFDQQAEVSREEAKVQVYAVPKILQFKDFRTMLQFERYVDAVAPVTGLELPQKRLSVAEVEARFPEFVEQRVDVEIAEVSRTEMAARVSVKQTWDWQLEESHFAALAKEFPLLGSKPAATKEERFAALQTLDNQTRLKVDQSARLKIAAAHPEWIDEALQKAPLQPQTLSLRLKGGTLPFKGLQEGKELMQFLQEGKELSKFSFDGEHFYSLRVMSKPTEKTILSFEEALADGTLDAALDRFLDAAYPSLAKRAELRSSDGSVRPFEEIKDELGALLYKDRLDAIRKVAGTQLSLEQCAQHRFDQHLKAMQQYYVRGQESPSSLWELEIREESWMRGDARFIAAEKLQAGQWGLGVGNFFQLIEKVPGRAAIEEIQRAQKMLAHEARTELLKDVL